MQTFILEDEYIPLIQLLKVTRVAQSGGEAQMIVEEGLVKVNGNLESRKRAKLRPGDIVELENVKIKISSK